MESLEIRKTRLDIVFKLFYPFIVVLGALIHHFGQELDDELIHSNLLLLGVAAFLIVLLFSMIRYIFYELGFFKEKGSEVNEKKSKKIECAYDDMFICFSKGGVWLLAFVIIHISLLIYYPSLSNYFNPSEISVAIFFWLSLILNVLPSNAQLTISGVNRIDRKCCKPDGCVRCCEKGVKRTLYVYKVKKLQWASWGIFLYQLLYLAWFCEGSA